MAAKQDQQYDVQYYLNHIAAYEREFKTWEGRVDKIVKRYRDEKRDRGSSGQAKFNVLWSNVQTLKAATFARVPMPDVSRRFKDNDPVGRVASMLLERALEFEVEHYRDFRASISQCVYDRFLGGRGTAWVRYEPTFKQVAQGEYQGDADQITEDVESETQTSEELDFECAPVDYVHWKDFGHAVARTWEECPIVWRKVYLSKTAIEERWPAEQFGEVAKEIPFDSNPDDLKQYKGTTDTDSVNKKALIYEIWDKEEGCALWLSKSLGKIIETRPDPLGLEEFFPCPPPLFSTLTTESLIPIPDFTLYQDQAAELDLLADRIDGLVKALQVKGVYDASEPNLARLFTEAGNGTLIPVNNWAAFAEKQGLSGSISMVDILPIAQALKEAYAAFEQIKGQIYELTGISDILRGQTAPSETATAQQIKNSYASLRLKVYQDEVEKFSERLLQLKAQIICSKFDAETICQMAACDQLSEADQQLIPQAIQLLKSNVLRNFRIEVATDSMVYQDEQQEKQDRMEFLTAVSQFMEKAVQAGQASPELVPLAVEMLKFGVTGFRVGKSLEGTIDSTAEQLKQRIAQQMAQPQPNPEQMQAQADLQKTQMQIQADQQSDQARAQADVAIENARQSAAMQMEASRQAHERQMEAMRQQHEAAMAGAAQQHQAQIAAMQQQHQEALSVMEQRVSQQLQLILAHLNNAAKVEVAEIAAQTTLDAAQISAANQASGNDGA
jgi:hypothetical protein